MDMNQEITEKIEKYLQGLMSEEEKRDFENEISQNKDLKKEVEQLSFVIDSIEHYGDTELRKRLNRIHNNISSQGPAIVRFIVNNKILSVAASVIIVISMYFTIEYFSGSMFNSEKVYLTYYSTPVYNQVTRNVTGNTLQQAELFYKQKEYGRASKMFRKLTNQDADDLTSFFYMAICLHETGSDSLALIQFDKIIERNNPALTDDALWYSAMIYIKQDKAANARKYLERLATDESSFYHKKAEEILGLRGFSE